MIIRLDSGGPVDLEGLGSSFAALARLYARHYGPTQDAETTPRLFISKLETGSIIAEIAPFVSIFGQAVPYIQQAVVIADFTKRVGKAIKAFAGEEKAPGAASTQLPPRDDVADIKAFVKPLVGRKGASLGISQARFERQSGDDRVTLEYHFNELELNRAALAMDAQLALPAPPPPAPDQPSVKMIHEAMLFFQQASRAAGKSTGRTADKAIIPAVSEKTLPVYFADDAGLKEQMVQGQTNPLTNTTYVVDAEVQLVDGEPRGYKIIQVHKVIDGAE